MARIRIEKSEATTTKLSANTVAVLLLLGFCALYYAGTLISQRSLIFDDSFITYRYARNLSSGYGIVWNPSEAPVEGYTNFLLVLFLAPFIKLGADPLWVTRGLSLLSMILMTAFLYRVSRTQYKASANAAALISLSFLLFTNTNLQIMVGLETVIFAAVLFLAYIAGVQYFEGGKSGDAYRFGLLVFAAFLLRPEALFLVLSFAIVSLLFGKAPMRSATLKPLTLAFALPLLAYLLWKYSYFGTILPNPFFIKAAASQLYSQLGLNSVINFIKGYWFLIILAVASVFICRESGFRQGRLVGGLFCLFYFVFYTHVDTLMDIDGRFLYPVIIFLMYLSLPIFVAVYEYILAQSAFGIFKLPLLVVLFIVVFNPASVSRTISNYQVMLRHRDEYASSNMLMQKERKVGMELSHYPDIQQLRIAFGDAGVIPYFSGALSLDSVGLNDRFIARERDLTKLTDYYFGQKPDLAILASNHDHTWVTYGHGPLGNFAEWSSDKRWDGFTYIGTVLTDGYDLQLFVRNDLENFDDLSAFLRQQVADGYYAAFPIQIGSYVPDAGLKPKLIPLPAGQP